MVKDLFSGKMEKTSLGEFCGEWDDVYGEMFVVVALSLVSRTESFA